MQHGPFSGLRLVRTLLCFAGRAAAQCYLEDANAACAVCWKTTSAGVTTFKECAPSAVTMEFTKPLPRKMEEGTAYPVGYAMAVDTAQLDVRPRTARGSLYHVPHSNIHSCIASRGACTPFVADSPGLSTHTPALVGNMSVSNATHLETVFSATVKLTIETYTIIAHNRFFVPDPHQDGTQSCYPSCLTRYDVAIGMSREVVAAVVNTSTDAYIGTGLVGFLVLASLLSIAWAAYKGKLDFDTILRALTREEVVLCAELVMGVGDVIAFTISTSEEIMQDNALVDIVPAAVFFCGTGWIVSIYGAFEDIRLLYRVIQQHQADPKYYRGKTKTILNQIGVETAGHFRTSLSTTPIGQEMILEYEVSSRERKHSYIGLATMLFEDMPFTAVGIYVMIMSKDVQMVVVVALALSSILVGSKAAGLGSFPDIAKRYNVARAAIEAAATGNADLGGDREEGERREECAAGAEDAEDGRTDEYPIKAADAAFVTPADENAELDTENAEVDVGGPSGFEFDMAKMQEEELIPFEDYKTPSPSAFGLAYVRGMGA